MYENHKFQTIEEIEPRILLSFFLEKMHIELNSSQINNNSKYIQNSDDINEAVALNSFLGGFTKKYNSIISNGYFGFMKTIRICNNYNSKYFLFNNFSFVTFSLDIVLKKMNIGNQTCNLYEFFKFQNETVIDLFQAQCSKCNNNSGMKEAKLFFSMPNDLIICFNRQNSQQDNINIIYDEIIELMDLFMKILIKTINWLEC